VCVDEDLILVEWESAHSVQIPDFIEQGVAHWLVLVCLFWFL
jgi:hypothetical protein